MSEFTHHLSLITALGGEIIWAFRCLLEEIVL